MKLVKITRQIVEDVALLSRLEVPEDQMDRVTGQLNSILEYVNLLAKVNTDGVEPTAHVLPLKNVLRADEVRPSLSRELALSNAPDAEDGYFKVPKIMEG